MDEQYWNNSYNSLMDPLQYALKQEPNNFSITNNTGTQNTTTGLPSLRNAYQSSSQLTGGWQPSSEQILSYDSTLNYSQPSNLLANALSDSLEERLKNSLADIDEERVLNCLSSPEPEIEELLFPELVHQHAQQPNVQQTLFVTQPVQVQQIASSVNAPQTIQNTQQTVQTPTSQQKRPRETASSSASTANVNVTSNEAIDVLLLHKPRGCKGIWQRVMPGEPLRVTKGKGKWLKVEIKSSHEIKSIDTEVFLVDASLPNSAQKFMHTEDEGITIESKTESNALGIHLVEVELKLDRVCKKLQLWAVCKSRGNVLKGKSVEFAAHNNGKASNIKPIKEEPESVSESSSSSSSSGGGSSSGSDYKDTIVKKKRRQDPIYDDEPSSVVPGSLKVNGVVRAKAFLQYSDLRLKANVTDLVDAVNIVGQLKGRTFTWKNDQLDPSGGKRVIGLIAQEVKRIIPEVVHETENGYLSVAYAEIVPILIEAFKEQMKQYNTDKEEVRLQLQVLESKLDVISQVLEKDQQIQQMQQENLTHLQLQQQQQQLLQMQQQQQILQQQLQQQQQQQQMVIPAPLKGLMFNLAISEPLPKKETAYKRNLLRMGVVVTFILGLLTITLGAILLGMTLSSPEQMLTTSVIEARDLKPMDRDGSPDSYCEVSMGSHLFRTQTIWNSNQPLFEETFSTPYDASITKIVYQMYDDDANPYFPPRRMGVATFDMTSIDQDKTYTQWLTLVPNIEGDEVSGQIQVSLYLSKPKKPGFELLLLFAGVFLTCVSMGLGYYVWRSGKKVEQLAAQQFVQMQTKV